MWEGHVGVIFRTRIPFWWVYFFKAGKVMIWIQFSVLAYRVLRILPYGVCLIDIIKITMNVINVEVIIRLWWFHFLAWWSVFWRLWQRIKVNLPVIFQSLGICYWIAFPRGIFLKGWPNFIWDNLILLKDMSLIFPK